MDDDNLLRAVEYRCHARGECYCAFVREYSNRDDLVRASLRPGAEGEVGRAFVSLCWALAALDAAIRHVPVSEWGRSEPRKSRAPSERSEP